MVLMFLNGGGMRGGSVHRPIEGVPLRRGGHKDITGYGGWRAYYATLDGPASDPAGA